MHTTLTAYRHSCPWQDRNPQSQQVIGHRPSPQALAQLDWQFKLMVGLIKHTEPTIQCAEAWTYCNGKQTVQHQRKQKSQLLKGANPTEESISSSISQAGEYKHHVLPIAREAT